MSSNSTLTSFYSEAESQRFIQKVGLFIDEVLEENDILSETSNSTRSSSVQILERLVSALKLQFNIVVCAIVYLDRLFTKNTAAIRQKSLLNILTTCTILAIKYNTDEHLSNKRICQKFGLSVQSVNQTERAVLKLLNFELGIDCFTLNKYSQ